MKIEKGPTIGETTFYQIDSQKWNDVLPNNVTNILQPSQWLKFVDIAAQQEIYPASKKIFVLTMERLLFVHRLKHVSNLIEECYEKGITIVLDVAIDDIPAYDCPSINKHFKDVEHLLHDQYFKILISVPKKRLKIDQKYIKHVVYYNYWAYQGAYNFNEWGDPYKVHEGRKYNFSCMIGRIFRDPRIYFISSIIQNGLFNDKFFTCAEPFSMDIVDLISVYDGISSQPKFELNSAEQEMFYNVIDILKCCNFKIDIHPDKIYEYIIQKHPFLRGLPDKTKHQLKHYFNRIIFDHPFVDSHGKTTSMTEMENFEQNIKRNYKKYNINYTHWDKAIPDPVYDSYINFACEGMDPYFSEKTYKPILAGVPFVNIISSHFTEMFLELGFEPYYNLFDYSFEKSNNSHKKIDNLVQQLVDLNKDRHFEMKVREQVGVVAHNQNQMKKIASDFKYITQL